MNETYYLDGKKYTFETQEELDAWLAENTGASKTNDQTDFNVEPVKTETDLVTAKTIEQPVEEVETPPQVTKSDDTIISSNISQQDFINISSGGFTEREEDMSSALYDIYNPERDENKVQFEQYGAGNNIRAILPDGDSEEIELSGAGAFGVETAKMKADHTRLVNFLNQKKELELDSGFKNNMTNVFQNRKETLVGDDLDGNMAKELNLLDLKDENGGKYTFKAVDWTTNAIEITLPNGSKKTFNVGSFESGKGNVSYGVNAEKHQKQTIQSIFKYIESNPSNYEQTEEYNLELKKIEKVIDEIITPETISSLFSVNDPFGPSVENNMFDQQSKNVLIHKIKKELGVLEGNFLGIASGDRPETTELVDEGKVKKFKDLTREQQNRLIENKIEQYVNVSFDNAKSTLSNAKFEGLINTDNNILTQADINNHYTSEDSPAGIYSRFDNEFDRSIYLNLQALDVPGITEAQANTYKNNITANKTLKQEANLGKKSSFFDINTMSYTYNNVENTKAGVYSIDKDESQVTENGLTIPSKKEKEEEIIALKLTRPELKTKAIQINAATDQWQHSWNNEKHRFILNTMGASSPEGDGVSVSKEQFFENGKIVVRDVVVATDAWAAKNSHRLQDFTMGDKMAKSYLAHMSRMQLGIDLKTDRAIYDEVYGLNQTVESEEQSGVTSFIRGIERSLVGVNTAKRINLDRGIPNEEFRNAFVDLVEIDFTKTDENGQIVNYEATRKEVEYAKPTYGETVGSATSGIPRMLFDFGVANKALGVIGLNKMVGTLVGNLNAGRYAVSTSKGLQKFTKNGLKNHINKFQPNGNKRAANMFKGVVAGSDDEAKIINTWMKAYAKRNGIKIKDISIPASFASRSQAVLTTSLFEGVKMELAMQMPAITGMGYDPETQGKVGEAFATGFGFGFMSGIVPWDKMFKAAMGTPATSTTKAAPGLFGAEAAYKGTKIPFSKMEIGHKGIYDYFVAAPLNFYAGSQFGGFTNQVVDGLMEKKSWTDWLDENYADEDHFFKHAVSELIMGTVMRTHKFNRFDFASQGRLQKLRQESNQKLYYGENSVYQLKNKVDPKTKKPIKRKVFDFETGKTVNKFEQEYVLRKGKTKSDAEKYSSVVDMASRRLQRMEDTKLFLDPVIGPLKFAESFKPALKELGIKSENFKIKYDYNSSGFNVSFVQPGKKYSNGLVNKTGELAVEATFNPKNMNPGWVPHELLHIGMEKLFSEDIMFKDKYIDGLIAITKEMKTDQGVSLYKLLVEGKVLKGQTVTVVDPITGEKSIDIVNINAKQVKEWELFAYVGEYFRKESNSQILEANYGFDKLATFTDKMVKEKFGKDVNIDQFNTRKELVSFYLNYGKSIGESAGIKGSLKHLEKFTSPTKTKNQQKTREQTDKFFGRGSTKELRSTDLNNKINDLKNKRKTHPAFLKYLDDKDVEKYKNNKEIQKINEDIKTMELNLKNMPDDVTFGEKGSVQRKINDFARVDNRAMTEKEWNAPGGGKEKALVELQKEGGAFDGIILSGLDFSKGGVQGRSRETWVEDVKYGITGKGKIDKKTGENVQTFISKGLFGVISRFNKGKWGNEGENESLSGFVNSQYQMRRGEVSNYYKKNPIAKSLESPSGKGSTIGDKLLAGKDLKIEAFENQNLSLEWINNKKGEYKEIVEIEGQRKAKNEIPIDKKVFENGWQKEILKNTPKTAVLEKMGYRDIMDQAPKFTEEMYGVKLSDAVRNKPNEIGSETNLKNGQEFVRGSFKVKVMEEGVNKEGVLEKRQQRVGEEGEFVTREVKNSTRIADILPEGTVKFDKGVSDKLVGRSAFPRLGTLGELYHLATPKNYSRVELARLGFETNLKPHSDGHWRAATGPGGRIFIKGKAKGQKLTGKDVEQYVGIKDGKLTALSSDRSLGGKLRRIMTEEGRHITEQTITEYGDLNQNIIVSLKGGKSRSFWSKTLEKEKSAYNRKVFSEEVRSDAYIGELLGEVKIELDKGNSGSMENAVKNSLVNHFELYKSTKNDAEFTMSISTLKTIAKEIYKEFKFTKDPKRIARGIAMRAYKSVTIPNEMDGVEAKYNLKDPSVELMKGPSDLFSKKDVDRGIVNERRIAKEMTEKYGVGFYESFFLPGSSQGGGIGKFATLKDMADGVIKGVRYSLFRSANKNTSKSKAFLEGDINYDAYTMLKSVYKEIAAEKGVEVSSLKKYTETTRATQSKGGVKKMVMEAIGLSGNGKNFNIENALKLNKSGEKNKEVLLESVESLMEAYKNGDVSQRVVRQWIEMHAGNMFGLIKTSASLSVLPNVKLQDLVKEYGTKSEDYVLEHMTPAKRVKSRIYDYILSKGDPAMKEAMSLTLRDHKTTLVPKKYDTMVNKTLQADLPSWHLPGMNPTRSRYYEANHQFDFDLGLKDFVTNEVFDFNTTMSVKQRATEFARVGKNIRKTLPKIFQPGINRKFNSKNLEHINNINKALAEGRKANKKAQGMSTFDFDETVGISQNFVFARKGKETKKIASNEWPFVGDKLLAEGWKMDFTDFNKVTKGKPGPLMQKMKNQIKKFGSENVFILTARAPESQKAIHDYLKSEGINIPIENITGLGNSTGEAKALWMLKKFSEGYNDMYFVDDAMPNVKAVKDVLDQLDIKSKVQQALMRGFNATDLNIKVNDILEHSLNIGSEKRFTKAEGKFRGKDKKRRRFFMADSAADLELLIEPLYGKGKKGKKAKEWFNQNYYKTWEKGINNLNTAQQAAANDYMALRKQNKSVVKSLDKAVEGTNFTNDAAMRVYIWNKAGFKIPGLAPTSKAKLVNYVSKNAELLNFAEKVAVLTRIENGLKQPTETWWGETIASEISEIGKGTSRKKYLGEWLERSKEIFSEENLNKMEAELGPKWRESMDNMLYRMETGSTRNSDMGRIGNDIMNYLNGSVGAIMNLNTRSAVLQLISTVNFINHAENNPFQAARAFANQPQYWKDFMKIMNSDMLKQRRDGLQINVTEAELAAAVNGKGSKAKRALSWILKQGYLPTKIADSFAISSGGATYYRNRARMYQKQGFSLKEAESKAFIDFQAVAERTQQSSRPDLLSKQQVSFEGRLLLPFANTPMQMNRIMIKEYLDISKGRYKGFYGEGSFTNKVSKIAYYGGIQSAIFAGLQTGLFALMANGDDDDLEIEKSVKAINTMADSFLRGMGISGVVAAGIKNAYLAFRKEDKRAFMGDFSEVSEALLNMSPTIGSKFSKLDGAGNTYKYNKKEIYQKGLSLDNTPLIDASTQTVEAIFNIPVNRAFKKIQNIKNALDDNNENWQRVMMAAGWSNWDVGVEGRKKPKLKKKSKYSGFVE